MQPLSMKPGASAGGRVALVAGLTLIGAAQAQSTAAVHAELAACRALRDVPARVACYDAIPVPAATPQPNSMPAPRAAARPAEAAASAPADFGLPPPIATQPQAMQSRIAGRFDGWSPGTRLRLDNGQVWEVVDGSRAAYDLNAPAVSVRRGVLGSYFLEIDGVSATPRVRRIQ
jgi:hypothetical protein